MFTAGGGARGTIAFMSDCNRLSKSIAAETSILLVG
jgi:hypothetical protein